MDPVDFINSPALSTPIERSVSDDLVSVLRERIDAFSHALKNLDDQWLENKSDVQSRVDAGSEKLLATLTLFLKGDIGKAYDEFELGIEHFRGAVDNWTSESPDNHEHGMQLFFRLRSSNEPKLAKRELFHIPFKLRHKVASQRFSIPGIPCLYTAGSTYTCWEEIGRPPFHELHVAALWVPKGESFRFLDLRWTARAVKAKLAHAARGRTMLNSEEKLEWAQTALASCIPIWPLIALCSVRVKHRQGFFKPEYIIPQMVLHWIASQNSIDGVAYESTHVDHSSPRATVFLANYAFPARARVDNDLCDSLRSKFRMTEPMPWPLLLSINPLAAEAYGNYELNVHPSLLTMNYGSDFGKVESALDVMAKRSEYAAGAEDDGRIS